MSSSFGRAMPHPVLGCVETVATALKETADVPVVFMAPAERRAALLELSRVEAQLVALRLRVMACSDDVALAEGARDVAALLTHHTRTDAGANRRDLALAEALDRRWGQVAGALSEGDLNVAQAQVITHALEELPADKVSADVLTLAEANLVAQGAHFGPRELRVLGRRILDIVAPEINERHEAEQLAAEELVPSDAPAWSARGSVTDPPGSPSTSPTPSRPGYTPTSSPTPHRGTTEPGRPTGSRWTGSAVRRSARCWRPSIRTGCRSTAGMRPR